MKVILEDGHNFSKEQIEIFKRYDLHENDVIVNDVVSMHDSDFCDLIHDLIDTVYIRTDANGITVIGPSYV